MRLRSDGLSRKDRSMFKLAAKMAVKSDCQIRHGAVVVRGGSILGLGFNRKINGATSEPYTIHAEVDALNNVDGLVDGATMYVVRIYADDTYALSLPCESCYNTMNLYGIKKVVFSDCQANQKM